MVELSEWFIEDDGVIYDIGTATGETIALLSKKPANKKNVRYVRIESSEAMINQAKQKVQGPNIEFLHQGVAEKAEFEGADLVMALYTLQFLRLKHRKKVLQRIYADLNPGGALILV